MDRVVQPGRWVRVLVGEHIGRKGRIVEVQPDAILVEVPIWRQHSRWNCLVTLEPEQVTDATQIAPSHFVAAPLGGRPKRQG